MAQKPWKKYLTEEQYGQLGPDGRMLADYWTEFLPKMCARMHSEGTLIPTMQQKAEERLDWHADMLRQGMREYEALDFIKEEVYALPPEE